MGDTTRKARPIIWHKVKIALSIFLPLIVLVNGILWRFYSQEVKAERRILEAHAAKMVEMQTLKIGSNFELIVADLMFFANYHQLLEMLDSSEIHDERLVSDFALFSRGGKIYDQVRILDTTGMETIRINLDKGIPVIVERLQYKGDRYYFKDTYRLNKGEVFVSPFDLNIENGMIEVPLKPMIRFGTPIFDRKGQKRGALIFNYLGANLIQDVKNIVADSPGFYMLLNAEGYWIIGRDAEDEWGFMYKDRRDKTMGKLYPTAWEKIAASESGQFYGTEGLFSFATVYPLLEGWKSSTGTGEAFAPSVGIKEAKEYRWKVVSYIPKAWLNEHTNTILSTYIYISSVMTILLGIGSWFLASARVKHNIAAREVAERTRELAETNVKLKEADRLKSVFLATMSHELRTPLNSIIGFTGILLQRLAGPLNDEQAKQLGMVRGSSRHLLDLINDILDISKIEAGQLELTFEPFDMREVIEKVAETVVPLAENKGLALITQVSPEVGQITSDRRRVEQILINLLSNAVKFTESGEVRVECQVRNDQLITRVVDPGIGIKPEDIPKVFEVFQQVSTQLIPRQEGTGLGLSICKKLVQMLDGEMDVESEWGVGSAFTFTLPLNREM